MKSNNSEKLRRFGLIVGTLIVMNILKGWIIQSIFMSIFSIALGDDGNLARILTILASMMVVGALTMLPLYWGIRENAEERRRFLNYFAEHEYNRANLKTYLKEVNIVRQDRTVFVIALLVVLIIQYGSYIVVQPGIFLDFAIEFVIIFGIYLLFDYFVRRKFYDKWESERLHK